MGCHKLLAVCVCVGENELCTPKQAAGRPASSASLTEKTNKHRREENKSLQLVGKRAQTPTGGIRAKEMRKAPRARDEKRGNRGEEGDK